MAAAWSAATGANSRSQPPTTGAGAASRRTSASTVSPLGGLHAPGAPLRMQAFGRCSQANGASWQGRREGLDKRGHPSREAPERASLRGPLRLPTQGQQHAAAPGAPRRSTVAGRLRQTVGPGPRHGCRPAGAARSVARPRRRIACGRRRQRFRRRATGVAARAARARRAACRAATGWWIAGTVPAASRCRRRRLPAAGATCRHGESPRLAAVSWRSAPHRCPVHGRA